MPEITKRQPNAHLGKGIAYPFRFNVQGNLQLSAAEQNIEESIQIILRTEIGERKYRPTFGSRLSELTFAPLNSQTLLLIRLYVRDALIMWEPRIVVDSVQVQADPIRGRVDIIIHYHPKEDYDARSLVYPFYLQPAGEA